MVSFAASNENGFFGTSKEENGLFDEPEFEQAARMTPTLAMAMTRYIDTNPTPNSGDVIARPGPENTSHGDSAQHLIASDRGAVNHIAVRFRATFVRKVRRPHSVIA